MSSIQNVYEDPFISQQEVTRGIEDYCVPQLNEITSKAQDILNEKESNTETNTGITETIASLKEKIEDLKQYTEAQKVQ